MYNFICFLVVWSLLARSLRGLLVPCLWWSHGGLVGRDWNSWDGLMNHWDTPVQHFILSEHCNRKLPGVFGKLLPNPVGKLRRPGVYIYIYTHTYTFFYYLVLSHTHIYIHKCISTYVHTYIFTYTCIEYYFWDRAWLVMQVHCKWVVIWPALCGSSVDP
jgi:hypothetical protein